MNSLIFLNKYFDYFLTFVFHKKNNNLIYILYIFFNYYYWGLGIGDWGLWIGDWA